MVLGRREISAILLAVGALLFYAVFLLSGQSRAQTNDNCPGAQVVNTFTGNGNQQTPLFNITGNQFGITTNVTGNTNNQMVFNIVVKDQQGNTIDTFNPQQPGTDSTIVDAGPGQFSLNILAANNNFTVTVEDCTGSQGGVVINNNGLPITNGVNPFTNNIQIAQGPLKEPSNIVNVPKKKLPPSGGLSVYGVVASFVLAGAGLLALGIGVRRGRRR